MLPLIKAIVYVLTGALSAFGIGYYMHTTSDRWRVKTLSDGVESLSGPFPTTVHEQVSLKHPVPRVDENTLRLPSERTLYTLRAKLVEVLIDPDDDFHLVIEDLVTKEQMIAEIPEPDKAIPEVYRKRFLAGRRFIRSVVGSPEHTGNVLIEPLLVEITGVGFFDEIHLVAAPTGAAPNGREIHPILKIEKIGS